MKSPSDHQIQVANLVLTFLLLVGGVAYIAMKDPVPPSLSGQSIESARENGETLKTDRWQNEPLASWRDRHIAAMKEFSK